MKIPAILVGCGNFSLQRLGILINENQFEVVACVDIDVEKAKSDLASSNVNTFNDLTNYVYATLKEAKKK